MKESGDRVIGSSDDLNPKDIVQRSLAYPCQVKMKQSIFLPLYPPTPSEGAA